ncbi:selenium cofactor biosynthesis protein YqeC [Miniphocaeibacter massiliensis]|uniref:selenium cofactor biosynthesis protein YqeC n=1 Tax=Miniphocaeibacter massiliensis TaxID=2041841 RepID=UPI0013E9D1F5|nr:selenium cofactor biosynthesis protein YqeC [Miniphocaeibacter massiliensis]
MLSELLELKKGDILSVVGSGGKTTTIHKLAKELNGNKVLLTTSAKIGINEIEDVIQVEKFSELRKMKIENNNYLSGSTVEQEKFTGIIEEDILKIKDKFDFIIIEADGSKRMPLKGWRKKEPIILESSNKTLGIIPFNLYGCKLDEIEIFNRKIFMEIVGIGKKTFDTESILKIINAKNGIFKGSAKEKYILLNKCDKEENKLLARKVILELKNKCYEKINFIYGSSITGEYYGY